MSGSKRGQQLYMLMANGNAVPSEIVTDLLGEAMAKKADSKVHSFSRVRHCVVLVGCTRHVQVHSNLMKENGFMLFQSRIPIAVKI